ncbi:MAG: hypothetical protein AW07_01213 [Candidatus Accumulibacter sp. SK-11]|nr:MAG: hypothetical protein AW07_01213 [Candidatus Accumulibacter sp. SK-11]
MLGDRPLQGCQQIRIVQLGCREVDRDRHFVAGRAPESLLPTRFGEHPGADRDDQSAILGHRNEARRRNQSVFRVPPANQRFGAEQPAAAALDSWLVVDAQLPALDRDAQVVLDLHSLARAPVHLEGKELGVVAALLLRLVHRRVSVAHQGFDLHTILGVDGDADAARDMQIGAADVVRLADQADQTTLDDLTDLLDVGDAVEDDDEFVAAHATHRVAAADATLQLAGHRPQDGVADMMTE